ASRTVWYDFLCYYLFFQAEDGIRDPLVTGVQTCALPISGHRQTLPETVQEFLEHRPLDADLDRAEFVRLGVEYVAHVGREGDERSEERRVGKECRGRWGRAELR